LPFTLHKELDVNLVYFSGCPSRDYSYVSMLLLAATDAGKGTL